jgi:hypothetical protein
MPGAGRGLSAGRDRPSRRQRRVTASLDGTAGTVALLRGSPAAPKYGTVDRGERRSANPPDLASLHAWGPFHRVAEVVPQMPRVSDL